MSLRSWRQRQPATDLERSGLRGFGAESGLGDELVEGVCAVLQALEAVAYEGEQPLEFPVPRLARLRLTWDHTPSTGLRSGTLPGNRNTLSHGRAAISSRMTAETWVLSLSPTPTFTTPSSTIFTMRTTAGTFVTIRVAHLPGPPDSRRVLRGRASGQG